MGCSTFKEENCHLLSKYRKQFLTEHNIEADLHIINGSVEIAPNIGLADAICDIVSSGSTLFKNNLKEAVKIRF